MTAKEIVTNFYSVDLAEDHNALSYVHKDCKIHWNSSMGLSIMNFDQLAQAFSEIKETYSSFAFEKSHVIAENNLVSVRYTIFASTIEKPNTDVPLGHFISIVELKDDKIFKVFQISQQADESIINMSAF